MIEKINLFKRNIYYFFNNVILKKIVKIKIKSIDETIKYIIENKCSVSRFGDGELSLINGGDIGFQNKDNKLKIRLKEILKSNEKNIIICLPGPLVYTSDLNDKARVFWNENLKTGRFSWIRNIDINKTYYNAHITRLYMDFNDKEKSSERFKNIKKIWENREIIIIEGENSKLGVGNNLFEKATLVSRIIAPNKNAFEKYTLIIEEAKKIDKDKLILIALGPTATVLSYDLCRLGYQAIDIGHIDIEYEWFLSGAINKVAIKNKFVNEVENKNETNCRDDINYKKQIISYI